MEGCRTEDDKINPPFALQPPPLLPLHPMAKRTSTRSILYVLYFLFVVAILLEVFLRIYNPFNFRIKGENIVLETNKTYRIDNSTNPRLDKSIVHTVNSLGFRGPDFPANRDSVMSIMTVGGSTTECAYINDGKTWTDVVYRQLRASIPSLWMNNAGLEGHSTYGHIVLMKDLIQKIRPDVVMFLVGVNDMRRGDLTASDKSNMKDQYKNVFTFISQNSELCNTIINLLRAREAGKRNLNGRYVDFSAKREDTLVCDEKFIAQYLAEDDAYLTAYRQRVQTLVDLCVQQQMLPVLITQPTIMGAGRDSATGVSLENFKVTEKVNGKLFWRSLEKYNDVVRSVAAQNGIPLIDLANVMPKSSLYFYDLVHFTNEGCEEVGRILSEELLDRLVNGEK